MFAMIQFDRPGWLILCLLIVPIIYYARHGLSKTSSRSRAIASTTLRIIVICLLAVAIARPVWNKQGEGVAVIAVVDRSLSVPQSLQKSTHALLSEWTDPAHRSEHDKLGVISIGKDAVVGSLPSELTLFEPPSNEPVLNATNLSKGVQLALALKPVDSASRILLVTDGNETEGDVLHAASLAAANQIPIDVLPLRYTHDHEVLIERVIVPAQAREGQTIPVRIVLRSVGQVTGRLHLSHNGQEISLTSSEGLSGLPLELNPGVNAFVFDIPIRSKGPQEFEATWSPDASQDTVAANNSGIGVSFVHSDGKVLIVTQNELSTMHLAQLLEESGIEVEVTQPNGIPRTSIGYTAIDSIILDNIPRWTIDDVQERHLHAFIHDLGGGLVFVGGPEAYGAGGWIGSQLEKAMPLHCEPPQKRELPRGALALIMHSCEMPKGNYWGQQMASAAVDSLSEFDYLGIIEYDWNGGPNTRNNSGWRLPLQLAGDKTEAHNAVKSLVFGDMQDFSSAMELALEGLLSVDAAQRHVIIISDGDPIGPSQELLQSYQEGGVTVSAVMVGGHGSAMDLQKMKGIATVTGGRFYMVNNPSKLPNIFIKEAQMNSRSLLQEGQEFVAAQTQSMSGPVTGIDAVPLVTGYVVTGKKSGLAQTPWLIPVKDADDPLLAWWNYGLGKSVAFTSDLGERWATPWLGWSGYQSFWERSVRFTMRSSNPPNSLVTSTIEGDVGRIDIELLEGDSGYLNFMRAKAVLVSPSGHSETIDLQQHAPGRYNTEFIVDEQGAWLVNVVFQNQEGDIVSRVPAAVTMPFDKEFATTQHNTILLQEVARKTGGRVLSPDDLDLESLFNDTGLTMPESPTSVWDLLAMLAASILILDVAVRRLWIDKESVQSMFVPVEQASQSSVEALKRVHKSSSRKRKVHIVPAKDNVIQKEKEQPKEPEQTESLAQLLKKKRSMESDDE